MKKIKSIPKFRNEDEERKFWAKANTSEYFDWNEAKRIKLTNLRPSLTTISIRLPESLLGDIKLLANKQDVPYQSLMKIYLNEMVKHEKSNKRLIKRLRIKRKLV